MSSLHSIELQIGTTIMTQGQHILSVFEIYKASRPGFGEGKSAKTGPIHFKLIKIWFTPFIYLSLTGIVVSKDHFVMLTLMPSFLGGWLIFASEVFWWLSASWTITVAPCFVTPLLLRRDVLYLASLRCVCSWRRPGWFEDLVYLDIPARKLDQWLVIYGYFTYLQMGYSLGL